MLVRIGYEKIFRQAVVDVIFQVNLYTAHCASECRPWEVMKIQAQLRRVNSIELLPEFLALIPVEC